MHAEAEQVYNEFVENGDECEAIEEEADQNYWKIGVEDFYHCEFNSSKILLFSKCDYEEVTF